MPARASLKGVRTNGEFRCRFRGYCRREAAMLTGWRHQNNATSTGDKFFRVYNTVKLFYNGRLFVLHHHQILLFSVLIGRFVRVKLALDKCVPLNRKLQIQSCLTSTLHTIPFFSNLQQSIDQTCQMHDEFCFIHTERARNTPIG